MPNGVVIAGGVSFPLLAPDGSAAAPSYSFASSPSSGMYFLGPTDEIGFSRGGSPTLGIINGGISVGQGFIGLGASISAADVIIIRDAANVLAQRNGANAQTFRLYNTYTDASNYERFSVNFASGIVQIRQEHAGSGQVRAMYFGNADLGNVFGLGTAGSLLWVTDNTYDIGAGVGTTSPRTIYASTSVVSALLNTTSGGVQGVYINNAKSAMGSTVPLVWSTDTNPNNTADLGLARLGAASLRLGLAPSATPVAQTLTVGEFSRVGTDLNVAGSNGTIRPGTGTGNSAGASLIFQTPTAGPNGTQQQNYATRLTLSEAGAVLDIVNQGLRINNQVSGAGASAGTLGNAPAAGNPTFWLPINIAGTVMYCPLW